nr:hypothetical protein [Psychromonas ossibalaenae]
MTALLAKDLAGELVTLYQGLTQEKNNLQCLQRINNENFTML